MKFLARFALFVSLSLLLFGCTSPPAQTPVSPTPLIAENTPLEKAVEQMKDFMRENPDRMVSSTAPIEADRGFQSAGIAKKGFFKNLNYMSSGSASIETKDGKNFIVFGDDFNTPNGPDVVVYLTKNSGPPTREDIKAGIFIGELKSTAGKQVYEIPAGVGISGIKSVTLHCRAFNVPWSYAPLD